VRRCETEERRREGERASSSRRSDVKGEAIFLNQRACRESVPIIRSRRSWDQRRKVVALKAKVFVERGRRREGGEKKAAAKRPSSRGPKGRSWRSERRAKRAFHEPTKPARRVSGQRPFGGEGVARGKTRPRSGWRAARRAAPGE